MADEQELTRLQIANEELTTRIALEKELIETKKQEAAESSYDAVMSNNVQSDGSVANVKAWMDEYTKVKNELDNANEQFANAIAAGDKEEID